MEYRYDLVVLLYWIRTKKPFDVGQFIWSVIIDTARDSRPGQPLGFPCLISHLARQNGIRDLYCDDLKKSFKPFSIKEFKKEKHTDEAAPDATPSTHSVKTNETPRPSYVQWIGALFGRSKSRRQSFSTADIPESSHRGATRGRQSYSGDPSWGYPPVLPQAFVGIETENVQRIECIRHHLYDQYQFNTRMRERSGGSEKEYEEFYCVPERPFEILYNQYPFDGTTFEQLEEMTLNDPVEEERGEEAEESGSSLRGRDSYEATVDPPVKAQGGGGTEPTVGMDTEWGYGYHADY